MAEIIMLDPVTVSRNRGQVDLTGSIAAAGPDWGDAEISAYMSDQAVGSSPVDYRIPNRMIKIPLILRDQAGVPFATVRRQVQQKVARFQQEGGWIGRVVDGTTLYADIVNASLHLGGSMFQAYRGFDTDAVLTLECRPDWFGDEITLDAASGNPITTILKSGGVNAPIPGDYPARCRILLSQSTTSNWSYLAYGFRSRYYDAAAPLWYPCGSLFGYNGAVSGTMYRVTTTSAMINTFTNVLGIGKPSIYAFPVHAGAYRVFLRAGLQSGGGWYKVRLQWWPGGGSSTVVYGATQIPSQPQGSYDLFNLGQVYLPPLPVGNQGWVGWVQIMASTSGQVINLDQVYLQPIAESGGEIPGSALQTRANSTAELRTEGHYLIDTTTGRGSTVLVRGDLPRVPVSGFENRPVEFFCVPCRAGLPAGTTGPGGTAYTISDPPASNPFTAQVIIRPCFLLTP
jgi:hypothetical protein